MNNGVDKKVCTFPETETRSISSCSSPCYGETAEDNTLLSADTCSTTSCSSDSCGSGFCNAGVESELEGEAGRVLEAVLRQPACSALRISSSEVRVGPSLTYNGPVTINVTMPPQTEARTTPHANDAPAEPKSQTAIRQPPQQRKMVSLIQIRSQVEMELPAQQQPVSHPPTPNQTPQQQPIFAKLVEPLPHLQQPLWKPVICAKQPRSMLQRNIQTAYAEDFRVVKPVGCQRIAAELTRTDLEGGAGAPSWCEQHLAVLLLLVMVACVLAIALSLVIRSRRGPTTPQPPGTAPNVRRTEKTQENKCGGIANINAHKQDGKNCSAAPSKIADPPKGGLENDKTGKPSTTPSIPFTASHTTSTPHAETSEQPASGRSTTTAKCKCNN